MPDNCQANSRAEVEVLTDAAGGTGAVVSGAA